MGPGSTLPAQVPTHSLYLAASHLFSVIFHLTLLRWLTLTHAGSWRLSASLYPTGSLYLTGLHWLMPAHVESVLISSQVADVPNTLIIARVDQAHHS